MKLLVINYHFPPDPSVGGLRWAGLTKYLARGGAAVDVLTSGSSDRTERTEDGVRVHRRARRRTLNDLYRGLARRSQGSEGGEGGGGRAGEGEGASRRGGLLATVRGELSALLAFPDYSRGWMLRARATAGALLAGGTATAVVSSGPPHSAHLAGGVARRAGVPHIVDLRDPWATHQYDDRIWWGIHARHIGRWLFPLMERRVFSGAAAVIANTERLRDLLAATYPGLRVVWIPNGVDLEELERADETSRYPGLSIAYTGTLYGGRQLDAVMAGFRRFLDAHPEAREAGSRIRVAGFMDPPHADRFHEERRRLGLEDAAEHLGRVPRERALELTAASSLSVVLAQRQQLQVPAKLYELVALGRPTLVVAEDQSASADEARRFGLPLLEPGAASDAADLFERIWGGDAVRADKDPERLSHADLAPEVAALVESVRAR